MNDTFIILCEYIEYINNNVVPSISPIIKEICYSIDNLVMEVEKNATKKNNKKIL